MEHQTAAARKIVICTLAIIGLIIGLGIAILLLLVQSQGDLLRSAVVAGDYHLASTVRAGTMERHLREFDRRIQEEASGTSTITARALGLTRIAHLIEREANALTASQRQYADPSFDSALRRLQVQCDRFAHSIATLRHPEPDDVASIRTRVDQLRLRLDQFRDLHWTAFLARDTLAEHSAGWRRFSILSIIVAVAALIPICIATRQIVVAVRERRDADGRRQLMQAELDHRVKNNLAAVLSLAGQTARASSGLREFSEAFNGRILAMARTHEALSAGQWSEVDLAQAASSTLAVHLEAVPPRIRIEGESYSLSTRAALPICLILHELSTNAMKHGALAVPGGRVSLSWARRDDGIDLTWIEHGGPAVVEPKSVGLGTQLIEGFVRHELRGQVVMDYRPEGFVCRIDLPLTAREGEREDRHSSDGGSTARSGVALSRW